MMRGQGDRYHRILHALIATLVTSTCFLQGYLCQIETELANQGSNTTTDPPEQPPTPSYPPIIKDKLRICAINDTISKSYCTCTDQVVTCDFSTYPVVNESSHLSLTLYGYAFPRNASRFCLCNTPDTLHINLVRDRFLPLALKNNFHRYDLYNLSGGVVFDGGFSGQNFHGDLYISKVYIPEIKAFEFGRGDDDQVQNVEFVACCSPIKVNQKHKKPVLYIDETHIKSIYTRGINDIHLWKSIILKSTNFTYLDTEAITITDNSGVSLAFLDNRFDKSASNAIYLKHLSNLLMVKNIFPLGGKEGNHYKSWSSRSVTNDSNILLIDNVFWNELVLDMDAQRIVSWYNIWDTWDNYTFMDMKYTHAPGRSISIKYNTIWKNRLHANDLNFGDSSLDIGENVLGTCDCSRMSATDKLLDPVKNRCFTGNVAEGRSTPGQCSILSSAAIQQCEKSSNVDFLGMCNDKSVSITKFPGEGTNLTDDVGQTRINSIFVSRIVHEFPELFGLNVIKTLVGSPEDYDTDKETYTRHTTSEENLPRDSSSKSSKSRSVAVPIVVSLVVIAVVFAAIFVAYKFRYRFLRRHHESLDRTRELFI